MSRLPLHPFFAALLPVLSMYSSRLGRSHIEEPLLGALAALLVVGALLAIGALLFKHPRKPALVISAAIGLLLAYDPVFARVEGLELGPITIGRHRYLLAVTWGLVAALVLWLVRTRQSLTVLTGVLNVALGAAVLIPIVTLAAYEVSRRSTIASASAPEPAVTSGTAGSTRRNTRPTDASDLPDVYYFIFDRYAGPDTLRNVYGMDNGDLYAYLESKGFYVARDSRSNYLTTTMSVASSLNLRMLDDLARAHGPDSGEWLPIYQMVRDHELGRVMRAHGYRHVHAGSWWWPSKTDPRADRNINFYTQPPRPVVQLLDSAFLQPVKRVITTPWIDDRRQQFERERLKLEALLSLERSDDGTPTFVFAHFLIPHPPYVFDRDGSFLPADEMNRRTWEQNYVNQVRATNDFIVRLVDGVLARSAVTPIIVVQSDEGPYPIRYRAEQDDFSWRDASPSEIREKTSILNAYLVPREAAADLYPDITPVNSFRVVLNALFGKELPLLEDRTIGHESDRYPYRTFDLTESADLLGSAPTDLIP